MKLKVQIFREALFLSIVILFAGCCHDCEPVEIPVKPSFKVYNESITNTVSGAPISAHSDDIIKVVNWNNIVINGKEYTINKTYMSYNLVVEPGNELEISAEFGKNPMSDMLMFSMPDGVSKLVSRNDSSFKWVVPDDIIPNSRIVANWADTNGNILNPQYSSSVILIDWGEDNI